MRYNKTVVIGAYQIARLPGMAGVLIFIILWITAQGALYANKTRIKINPCLDIVRLYPARQ